MEGAGPVRKRTRPRIGTSPKSRLAQAKEVAKSGLIAIAAPRVICLGADFNVEDRAMAALIVFSIIASGIAALSVAVWMGVDLDRRV